MSDALITKYRPGDFKKVVGQASVVRALERAVKDRLGTAFLFTGPSGVGKTTLARIAAKALGCSAIDLQEVDAATETGIDEMRKVIDGLMYRPLGEGAVKAIIIDECHALSKAAVTALLKSLEDPPSWVYWFLCTTDDAKIPKAVKTRCLTYNLREVSFDDLYDLLASTEEGKDIKAEVLELCAEEASGSPRQALSNLGVCLEAKSRKEAAELLRAASESPAAFDLAKALFKGARWSDLQKLLGSLKETNPESVRHVVRAYATTVILGAKSDRDTENAIAILEEFSKPFPPSDGISPLVLACGRLTLSE